MSKSRKRGNSWRRSKDPLWRGDAATLSIPDPSASDSIVRHVLYLGGAGRPTPYHSTTEVYSVAQMFAAPLGKVFETTEPNAAARGAQHLARTELLMLLKGKGRGKAKWHSAFEVMQARRNVEQWHEHLLSFVAHRDLSPAELQALVMSVYK